MKIANFFYTIQVTLLLCFLTSCSTLNIEKKIDKDAHKVNNILNHMNNMSNNATLIHFSENIFISNKPFDIIEKKTEKLPEIFNEKYIFNSGEENFIHSLINHISQEMNINIRITTDAESYLKEFDLQKKSIKLNHNNSFKHLLDNIASHYGLWWKYTFTDTDKMILFYRMETKTYLIEKSSEELNNQEKSSSSHTQEDDWESITKTLELMIGKSAGNIKISKSDGYITVITSPDIMRKIDIYIDEINRLSRQRIAIKINLYDIIVDSESKYGLEWNKLNDTINIPQLLDKVLLNRSSLINEKIILSALQKIGKTNHITGTTVYTINGKSVPATFSKEEAYIKEISTVTSENNAGHAKAETKVITDVAKSGFFMNVRPKIINNNEILLYFSLNLSSVDINKTHEIDKIKGENGKNTLQLPRTSKQLFTQIVPIKSGSSTIINAFQNEKDNMGNNSLIGEKYWMLGGNKSSKQEHQTLLIIATAYIIEND